MSGHGDTRDHALPPSQTEHAPRKFAAPDLVAVVIERRPRLIERPFQSCKRGRIEKPTTTCTHRPSLRGHRIATASTLDCNIVGTLGAMRVSDGQ